MKEIPSCEFVSLRRMRWAGQIARIREMGNAYNILVGKPEGKIPLRRTRDRWKVY
jgi:hypothetical protein